MANNKNNLDERIKYAFSVFYTQTKKCRSSRPNVNDILDNMRLIKYDPENSGNDVLLESLFDAKFKFISATTNSVSFIRSSDKSPKTRVDFVFYNSNADVNKNEDSVNYNMITKYLLTSNQERYRFINIPLLNMDVEVKNDAVAKFIKDNAEFKKVKSKKKFLSIQISEQFFKTANLTDELANLDEEALKSIIFQYTLFLHHSQSRHSGIRFNHKLSDILLYVKDKSNRTFNYFVNKVRYAQTDVGYQIKIHNFENSNIGSDLVNKSLKKSETASDDSVDLINFLTQINKKAKHDGVKSLIAEIKKSKNNATRVLTESAFFDAFKPKEDVSDDMSENSSSEDQEMGISGGYSSETSDLEDSFDVSNGEYAAYRSLHTGLSDMEEDISESSSPAPRQYRKKGKQQAPQQSKISALLGAPDKNRTSQMEQGFMGQRQSSNLKPLDIHQQMQQDMKQQLPQQNFNPAAMQQQQGMPMNFNPTAMQQQQGMPMNFNPAAMQQQQGMPMNFNPAAMQQQQQGFEQQSMSNLPHGLSNADMSGIPSYLRDEISKVNMHQAQDDDNGDNMGAPQGFDPATMMPQQGFDPALMAQQQDFPTQQQDFSNFRPSSNLRPVDMMPQQGLQQASNLTPFDGYGAPPQMNNFTGMQMQGMQMPSQVDPMTAQNIASKLPSGYTGSIPSHLTGSLPMFGGSKKKKSKDKK